MDKYADDIRKANGDRDLKQDQKDIDHDQTKDKDNDSEENKAEDAKALIAAKAFVEAQDELEPSPKVDIVVAAINRMPGTKLSGGKRYQSRPKGKGEGHFEIYYNPTVKKDYTVGSELTSDEIEAQKQKELNSRKMRISGAELKNELVVRGFNNAGELVERLGNLRNKIKNIELKGIGKLDDVEVGIRGSSVTGKSSKGGEFRQGVNGTEKPSDLDFFFSSKKLDEALKKRGFDLSEPISPNDLSEFSPELVDILGNFGNESRQQLGRNSDAYFLSNDIISNLIQGEFILQ